MSCSAGYAVLSCAPESIADTGIAPYGSPFPDDLGLCVQCGLLSVDCPIVVPAVLCCPDPTAVCAVVWATCWPL